MAMFNNPRPTSLQPKRHEGSPMRSVRDSDNVARSWLKNKTQQQQNNSDGQAIGRIQQEILRMRRRIVGGSVGFKWNETKEFDMAIDFDSSTGGEYLENDVVTVSPDNIATLESNWNGIYPESGYLDPDSGLNVWSRPGTYVCLQECNGTHLPQWPAPNPNDITDPLNFWWPISGLKSFRGTWGISPYVANDGSAYFLGTGTGFMRRFADGDVVIFTFQQNTPSVQQFGIPFMHVGNTLEELLVPTVDDITQALRNPQSFSQAKWMPCGFCFVCDASPLDTSTMIPAFSAPA